MIPVTATTPPLRSVTVARSDYNSVITIAQNEADVKRPS
jgi:hypothetical protein